MNNAQTELARSPTMTCTRCFRDTGMEPPDTSELPVEGMVALAIGWLCNDCLDLAECERGEHKFEDGHCRVCGEGTPA